MLQAMRSGAHSQIIKFVFFGLLIMGVSGLVLMDVGGYFRRGVSSTDVAKISGESISLRQFDMNVRTILRRQGLDPQLAYQLGYVDQILLGEIQDRLLARSANDIGIKVGDDEVAGRIARLMEPILDENTTPQQALDRVLATQGVSEKQFVNSIRQEMTNAVLRGALTSGAQVVPAGLAEDLYLFDREKRIIDYIQINEKDFANIGNPDEETLRTFYEAVKEEYVIPERRTITLAILKPETIAGNIEIPVEDLERVYNENIELYTAPEKRKLAQVIVDQQDLARKIYEKASAGKPLKTAATEVTGSADNYLGEEVFEKEGLFKDIADIAFSLEKGTTAEPVQTPLGWHVIKVTDVIPAAVSPFDKVKDTIRKEQEQMLLSDQLFEISGEVDDLIAGGATLEDAIEKYQLTRIEISDVDASGKTSDQKNPLAEFAEGKANILETAFSEMEGDISPVQELPDGSFAIVRTDKIQPKRWTEFEKIKKELAEKWTRREQRLSVARKADELITRLQQGATMQEISRESGYELRNITIERNAEPGKIFDANVRMKLFSIDEGEFTYATTGEGQLIGRIREISFPEKSTPGEKDLELYIQTLHRIYPNELLQAYLGSLADRYKVQINRELLQRAYGGKGEE